MWKNSHERYGIVSKVLHWAMALMILSMIGLGVYMTGLELGDSSRFQLYSFHKSIGVTILILAIIRFFWIHISPPPKLPRALIRIEAVVAKIVQALLYVLMIATPLVGYLMSNSAGYGVNYFGMVQLPRLLGKNHAWHEIFAEAHAILAFAFLFLVALHVAGALKHRFLDKNVDADVLKRML
ncbi:hypothetical protein TI05_06615 [Achromatium sp. WMS3]|nr:hypothetical protein TI05_06615 [Achromatium sp. WMS3]